MPKGNRSTKQLYTFVTRSKVTFRHEVLINALSSMWVLGLTGRDFEPSQPSGGLNCLLHGCFRVFGKAFLQQPRRDKQNMCLLAAGNP